MDEGKNDLRLELRVKNNHLYRAIYDTWGSIAHFCRDHPHEKFHQSSIGELMSFRRSPIDPTTDDYSELCFNLSSVLGIPCDELFPRELYKEIKVGKQIIEVSSAVMLPCVIVKQVEALPAPAEQSPIVFAMQRERDEQIEKALRCLPERQREALKHRYGLCGYTPKTYEELGVVLNVTGERARQIELKALRKLQHPTRAKLLEDFV